MKHFAIVCLLLLGATPVPIARAVTAGQSDTFQDGTTDNWTNGHPTTGTPPTNIGTGGPAGAGDKFLEITSSGGAGADSRLTTFNRTQWLGNYVAAGITEIDMNLENLGTVSLSIRLAFRASTANGAPGYLTSTAFTLAPNSGWQHATFLINASSLTAVGTPTSFSSFFNTGPAEVRIIDEAGTTSLDGDVVMAQLGIDNIVAVPECGAVTLILLGAFVLRCVSRFKRQFSPQNPFSPAEN